MNRPLFTHTHVAKPEYMQLFKFIVTRAQHKNSAYNYSISLFTDNIYFDQCKCTNNLTLINIKINKYYFNYYL